MTDQTIPAEKVRGVINEIDGCLDGTFLNDQARRALEAAKVSIENVLPTPPQPTTGLLGRWAKHPEYGDVVCIWDRPDEDGCVFVRWVGEKESGASDGIYAPLASLTFPEQATRPEDVPENQPWLVDVNATHFKAEKATGLRREDGEWLIVHMEGECGITWDDCYDNHVALIAPLTPERPGAHVRAAAAHMEKNQ